MENLSWPAPPPGVSPAASNLLQTSFNVKRVSRTRLNMLGSYASRDHRAMAIKQRRLVSEFPRPLSGTMIAGLMDIHIRRLSTLRYRGRDIDAITSLLERR
jgi:hypothetical protein